MMSKRGSLFPPQTVTRRKSNKLLNEHKSSFQTHNYTKRQRDFRRRNHDSSGFIVTLKLAASLILLFSSICTILTETNDSFYIPDFFKPLPFKDVMIPEEILRYDAYGIAQSIDRAIEQQNLKAENDGDGSEVKDGDDSLEVRAAKLLLQKTQALREEFASLYGGEHAARVILYKGLSTFPFPQKNKSNNEEAAQHDDFNQNRIPKGLIHTARRILKAKKEGTPFRIGFAGYSVTTGRGNYHHQSFPFVVQDLLDEPMKILNVQLDVRNAAIGGVPSFPYGWCLENFLGGDANVVSWDYSMNEANDIQEGMEAYVRQILTMDNSPMLIAKDTHMAVKRRNILQRYVELGLLADPIIIHTDPATEPLNIEESMRPIGFQEWRKFGAPPGAPGMSKHHPAVKEHIFIGWLIAMHFLSVLELIVASLLGIIKPLLPDTMSFPPSYSTSLPPPISVENSKASSILYGFPTNKTKSHDWEINPSTCRTTFEPILSGNLDDIVISGVVREKNIGLMFPKGPMFFNRGWVLDLEESEKKAKQKLLRHKGLGFVDNKKAFYGIHTSGPLIIFLPHQPSILKGDSVEDTSVARDLIRSIVVCEVNSHRGPEACDLKDDVSYTIGGYTSVEVSYLQAEGVSYLGKKICVSIEIPEMAQVTTKANLTDDSEEESLGIDLQIAVVNKQVTINKGACSVSHIVWENIPQ